MPCSGGQVNLWAEVWAYDPDELDQVTAALAALRPLLQASLAEADCELHDHP